MLTPLPAHSTSADHPVVPCKALFRYPRSFLDSAMGVPRQNLMLLELVLNQQHSRTRVGLRWTGDVTMLHVRPKASAQVFAEHRGLPRIRRKRSKPNRSTVSENRHRRPSREVTRVRRQFRFRFTCVIACYRQRCPGVIGSCSKIRQTLRKIGTWTNDDGPRCCSSR
jgi:hypothetical protein